MKTSTCRGCGAKIKWIQMTTGKWMPCDPELVEGKDLIGNDTLITEDGMLFKYDLDDVDGYVPHWATCPKAGEFRK